MKKSIIDKYTVVVGLEVHAQLATKSKIYAADSTSFGSDPNTNVSIITLGHPGTLPKMNKTVMDYAIKMGLACDCEITRRNIFCRKNYFYPDLPKGYQLTQDKTPICIGGNVQIKTSDGIEKKIRLNRIHVEEDAGKSIHQAAESDTFVDLNRAGVPLIEIVTEPDIRSSEEATLIVSEIRKTVRYLEICDGNMEEGSLRCDANVSVMLKDATEYGQKVELKNMNSIRNVKNAIDHEVERQIGILEKGGQIISETRTYNPDKGTSQSMREKENLNDYRYFPEPDLSPVVVSDEWLEAIRTSMPKLPKEYVEKFISEYNIPEYDALVITESKDTAVYYDTLCAHTTNYKAASNWMMGPVKSVLNDRNISAGQLAVTPDKLAAIIKLVDDSKISYTAASQQLFPSLLENPEKDPLQLANDLDLIQESDSDNLKSVVEEVLNAFPDKVKAYKNGKKGLIGMFMGEVMKKTRGKADPKLTNKLLSEILTGN